MSTEHDDMNERSESGKEYLTVFIGHQMFGIPVLKIQDVLQKQPVTRIPLSRPEILGSLNLRGRIVTAINMRKSLQLADDEGGEQHNMNIVIDDNGELYSIVVDKVGDVLMLSSEQFEKNPSTLEPALRAISEGIYRLDDELLVVLDVQAVLESLEDDKMDAA